MTWFASGLSALILVLSVEPWFILPAAVLSIALVRLARTYNRTSRVVRRMVAVAHSPLYSSFGELLDGIVTVRAFSGEERFRLDFEVALDGLLSKRSSIDPNALQEKS